MFTNARYADQKHKTIIAEREDGTIVTIPTDPANRDYGLLTQGDGQMGIAPVAIADYVPPAPDPYPVNKYTIITRLDAFGKFADALAGLKADDLLYEKWSAVSVIHSDDQPARDLFTAIGLDPDVILAEE